VHLRVEMEDTVAGSRGPKRRGHAAPNLKIISNKLSILLSSLLSISNFSLQTVQSTVQNNTLHDRLHDLL
jgi:hypothetical protein